MSLLYDESYSFLNRTQSILIFLLISFFLLLITLSYHYEQYLKFTHFDTFKTQALLIDQEQRIAKNGTPYYKLSFQKGMMHFISVSFLPLRNLIGHTITLEIKTQNISFIDYLKGFYAKTTLLGRSHLKSKRFELAQSIEDAHKSSELKELFSALFLATPIHKELRSKLSALGINHLAALSGFHLGFLALMLAWLFKFPYDFWHKNFVPYRHKRVDLLMLTLLILGVYLLFLQAPPALLRAYVMFALGVLFYDRGLKLISLELLIFTISFILILFPQMVFALGFWFSALGVFSIFILIKHYQKQHPIILTLIINAGVFILMLPFVLYIFKGFSLGQLLSPLLSLLFILFYPLSFLAHFLGMPTLFDSSLEGLFSLEFEQNRVEVPTLFILFYGSLFLAAFYTKKALYLALASAVLLLYFSPIL